jgi:hypothetical protein
MTPKSIKKLIADKSNAIGISEATSLGLADLVGFGKKYNQNNRLGVMATPKNLVGDVDSFLNDPIKQVDSGLYLLNKAKEKTGSDFGALVDYTGDPTMAIRAYLRGTKYSGEKVGANELTQSIEQLGLNLNPQAEAMKAGIKLADDSQIEQPEVVEPAPQPPTNKLDQTLPQQQSIARTPDELSMDYSNMMMTSSKSERQDRVKQAFGDTNKDVGISEDLSAYIGTIV